MATLVAHMTLATHGCRAAMAGGIGNRAQLLPQRRAPQQTKRWSKAWHSLCFFAGRRLMPAPLAPVVSASGLGSALACGVHRARSVRPWPSSSDMQQPRFRRQSVRRALSFLKERLWSNALVLSTRLVPAVGWHRLAGAPEDEAPTSLVPVMSEGRLEEPSGRPVYSSSHSGARVRRPQAGRGIMAPPTCERNS